MGLDKYRHLPVHVASIDTGALTDDASYLLVGLASPDQPHAFEGPKLPILAAAQHTTIALAEANPDTITRVAGSFTTDGYLAGSRVRLDGSAADDDVYSVESQTATVLTLDDGDDLATESATADITITGRGPLRTVLIWGYRINAEKTGDGEYVCYVGPVLENDGTNGTIAQVLTFNMVASGNATDSTDRFNDHDHFGYPIVLQVSSGALVGESVGFGTSADYTELQNDANYTAVSGSSTGRQPQVGDLAFIADETGGTGGLICDMTVWYSVF